MRRERHASAVLLVLAAATSVQGGASVAKSLFPSFGPPGVVFLRLLFGSIALWAIARPELRGRPWHELRLLLALGVVLVSMNVTFYESIDRLPLGIAVTVEFLGPLGVAVLGSRRRLDFAWVALAGTGVALLAEGGGGKTVHALGLLLAAVAGLFWALYILLSVPIGRAFPGASGLAPAMVLGALLIAPWGIVSAGGHLRDPQLVGAAVGVGLLSSALPWSLELEALRRLPTHVFGVVLSLEPAVAALAGFVFLHEHLRTRAWLAIGLVVLASAGAARHRHPPAPPDV
ncbi:MAG TPA: EamA family transporter [Gaiellaceae bacterium]|nr:EamA family transporter [Gaiellaceae bacterium]